MKTIKLTICTITCILYLCGCNNEIIDNQSTVCEKDYTDKAEAVQVVYGTTYDTDQIIKGHELGVIDFANDLVQIRPIVSKEDALAYANEIITALEYRKEGFQQILVNCDAASNRWLVVFIEKKDEISYCVNIVFTNDTGEIVKIWADE